MVQESTRRVGARGLRMAALTLGLLTVAGCGGKDYGPVDGARAMQHVEAMVAIGPRPAGSPELQRTRDYIRAELAKLGIELHEQRFRDEANAPGIEFCNLWAELPGEDPKDGPILMLASHYDTKLTAGHPKPEHNFRFVGAIDGGGSSALLIELARVLKDRKNKPNIRFVWFDGEESLPYDWVTDAETNLFGSRYMANQMSESGEIGRLKMMILLDLIGSKDFKIDRDFVSFKPLSELFLAVAEEMGEHDRMFRFVSQMTDDHVPFQKKGVKVIDLIDFRYRQPNDRRWQGDRDSPEEGEFDTWWHTTADDLPAMDPDGLSFVGNLVYRALPRIEEKYFR